MSEVHFDRILSMKVGPNRRCRMVCADNPSLSVSGYVYDALALYERSNFSRTWKGFHHDDRLFRYQHHHE